MSAALEAFVILPQQLGRAHACREPSFTRSESVVLLALERQLQDTWLSFRDASRYPAVDDL